MKKRIISFMTALSMTLMIFTSMPISISAADDIMMIPIDETNFPDENFRKYVKQFDTGGDGVLQSGEIAAVKEINVYNQNISDIKGIEYFIELESLNCVGNNLTALDISKNTKLKNLYCNGNNLTALDISKNTALTTLECSMNHLTALDVSKNTALENLDCSENNLTVLDVSKNTALTTLYCSFQRDYSSDPLLTALDVSKNTALTSLNCDGNKLTALDVSQNTALTTLACNNNQLVALDISKNTNLTNVFCEGNKYTVSGCMIDPADLPGSFDLSKASNWTNAKIENGKIISGGTGMATYTYNCGNGKSETFSIQFGQHNYVDGTCTVCGEAEPNAGIAINEENFPDENFRKYVSDNCDTDKNGSLSDDEIAAVTTIDVNTKSISDMKGIEYFTALESLDCSTNNLTALDISKNTALTTLKCSVNQLTALDVSQNPALESLDCFNNNLTSLNVRSNHALTTLECGGNQLTALDVSQNTALTTLECCRNQLTSLNVGKNTALTTLKCYKNQLTSLYVRRNPALTTLLCFENSLSSLDVSQNTALTSLDCDKNQLTSLDVSQNTALTSLNCNDNQLTSLDVSQNTALTSLQCYNNQIVVQTCVFDHATLTNGFELSKTSNWTNAEITDDNKIFCLGTGNVTYTYDCGNSRSAIFTLVFPSRSLTKVDKKDATCTEDGNIEYYECSCGCKFKNENPAAADILSDEDIVTAATGHNYVNGTCTVCGARDDNDKGKFEITANPSEKTIAKGEDFTVTVLVTGTTPELENVDGSMQPTYDDTIVSVNGGTDTDDGWVYTITGVAAGTTTVKFEWTPDASTGIDLERPITVSCEVTVTDGNIPSHTHTLTAHAAVDATCTAAGNSAYWTCSDCGKIFSDENGTAEISAIPTIPALGHNYVDGVCTRCGDVQSQTHTHTGGTATCTARAICTVCGQEYGELLPHSENGGVMTVQPTETTGGEMTYRCTVCGTVTRTVTIPPTGEVHNHVFGTEWKYSDTRHWHECVCGERADETLHTPDGGTVTKQPTAYETGVRTYYCTVCGGVIFSETIPATGTAPAPVIPYFPSSGTIVSSVPVNKEPYLQNDSGKRGWEVISDDIWNAVDGETVEVNMNGTTELPQNIVSNIAGRDIDLVLDMGSYSWNVNGMSVTKAKTVNMRVRKVSKIPESTVQEFFGDSKTVQLDLRHNGDFGFIAELTIDIGNRYSGKYANSYCYKSRTFEFGDSGEIVNGKAKLRFVHASSWLITIDDYPVMEDVSSGAAAHSAGTPIDMSNSTSGVTLPEFDEKKKLRLSNSKRRYRILKKRKLDDMVFVL